MKVLVIQQKMIGDVLTSSIICEAIKKNNTNSEIHYIANTSTIPVIKNHSSIDKIIEFKNEYKQNKFSFLKFLMKIRKVKYDWVIDAYGKIESNLISIFVRAKRKTSYHKWYTSFIYNDLILRKANSVTNAGLAIENRLRLVLEEDKISKSTFKPEIHLTKEEIDQAKKMLFTYGVDFRKPIVMISVLGSSHNKTLPSRYMGQTIDEIVNFKDVTILYNYIPSQIEEAKKIFELCSKKTQISTRLDVFGGSLREFLAILYHCTVLIGNEGGAVNMAKALNKPTFTIFSPWIEKEDWNLFENNRNKSVHLKDYKPQLFISNRGKIKKQSISLYLKFTPELYKEELILFLKNNV